MHPLFRLVSSLLTLLILSNTSHAADSEEYPGHDHARKVIRDNSESSNSAVEKKYTELLQLIRSRFSPDDEGEHSANTARQLEQEHKSWLDYRDNHCWLEAYLYVYPAGSRIFSSQYNACTVSLNNERLKFLSSVELELNN